MLNLEQTKELYDLLRGESEVNIKSNKEVEFEINKSKFYTKKSHLPRMTDEQAFLVIYILQEAYRFEEFIPDHYEICSQCGELHDSELEGGTQETKCTVATVIQRRKMKIELMGVLPGHKLR